MKRFIISVDIDDVLADNAKGFVDFSNKKWGTRLSPSDYEEDWAHMWQVDHNEVEIRATEFFGNGHVYHYEHDVTALEVLEKLKVSFELIVVTARRMQTKGDTLRWVKEKYPGIFEEDKIYFAGIWDTITAASHVKTKGALLKDLGVSYHIDDQLKHCIGAYEQGIQSILFGEYSWNKPGKDFPETIVRAKDWSEVLEYFNGRTT